jgi:hypothetical protein
MSEKKKGELIQLFKDGAKSEPGSSVSISGNSNVVGDNNTVVKTDTYVHKVKAEPKPGEEHITNEQVSLLKGLVAEIVSLEKKLKKKPRHYRSVWTSLFRHVSKNKKHPEHSAVRLIPAELFDKSEKYLRQTIGRLSSMKSAKKKDSDWRKRKYAYIKINVKKHQLESRLDKYLRENHNVESISELTDKGLELTYASVARWSKQGA